MLSTFIQQLRKKHSLTQEFLASKLGMSRPTYMQIERGERDLTITEARKLADVFDIPFENFLRGDEGIAISVSIIEDNKKNTAQAEKQEIRISVPQKNLKKFKEVLLYILSKVGGKPNVGETVLYKLLYFIDFDYYEKFEEQLIGATYIKNHYGPTPVEFKKIVEHMELKGELETVKSNYFQHEQKKYLPHRAPDLSILTAQEKEHIDEVLSRLGDKNATELSNYSHGDTPWIVAETNKPIDYEMVFYRSNAYAVREYEEL
ncbi:MAG: type II toxin-antitoxin system antitoxin SocA domain-containing protein [Patescibacteria group bacterium]